jgi:hypothetical protein
LDEEVVVVVEVAASRVARRDTAHVSAPRVAVTEEVLEELVYSRIQLMAVVISSKVAEL